jgi:hypothetical protein
MPAQNIPNFPAMGLVSDCILGIELVTMKRLSRSFLTASLVFCANSVAAERIITVETGLWEYTHSLMIPGLLTPSVTPKTECITPEEAKRSLSDLLGELSHDAGCTVTNLKDTLNTVKFDLSCKPRIESVSLNLNSHLSFKYGRSKITGNATGMISINGAEMSIAATGAAHRIGRCKK